MPLDLIFLAETAAAATGVTARFIRTPAIIYCKIIFLLLAIDNTLHTGPPVCIIASLWRGLISNRRVNKSRSNDLSVSMPLWSGDLGH